jgi:peptidoglycan L-alanyl-D-glutamate endopeptidase CwlK
MVHSLTQLFNKELSMFKFSARSIAQLNGVHADLKAVVLRAIELSTVDFAITEGVRDVVRQQMLVNTGQSRTLLSRHLTGHAVDVVAMPKGKVSWAWEHYEAIATAMKQAAKELNVSLEWGGDWETFKDGPHFQLSKKDYPK